MRHTYHNIEFSSINLLHERTLHNGSRRSEQSFVLVHRVYSEIIDDMSMWIYEVYHLVVACIKETVYDSVYVLFVGDGVKRVSHISFENMEDRKGIWKRRGDVNRMKAYNIQKMTRFSVVIFNRC
jgi:hypothetical protein